jgi:hypothetical protein
MDIVDDWSTLGLVGDEDGGLLLSSGFVSPPGGLKANPDVKEAGAGLGVRSD